MLDKRDKNAGQINSVVDLEKIRSGGKSSFSINAQVSGHGEREGQRRKVMKLKIGTQIEKEIMKLTKRKAAEEGRSISDLIQDALVQYLSAGAASPKEREMAYQSFCERPLKLKPEQLRQVLEEDVWDR